MANLLGNKLHTWFDERAVCVYAQTRGGVSGKLTTFLKKDTMNPTKLIGIILIAAGGLGLVYGGFSYPKETTALKLGTLELQGQETKTVNSPLILSAGAIVLGAFLLVLGRK